MRLHICIRTQVRHKVPKTWKNDMALSGNRFLTRRVGKHQQRSPPKAQDQVSMDRDNTYEAKCTQLFSAGGLKSPHKAQMKFDSFPLCSRIAEQYLKSSGRRLQTATSNEELSITLSYLETSRRACCDSITSLPLPPISIYTDYWPTMRDQMICTGKASLPHSLNTQDNERLEGLRV
jgi:hypothetical protein